MEKSTHVEVREVSDCIWKDDKGFFVYLTARSRPVTSTGIKAYITEEEDLARVESLYRRSSNYTITLPLTK